MMLPKSVYTRIPKRLPLRLKPVTHAMYFNGVNNYVALGFGVAPPFTVVVWANFLSFPTDRYMRVISQGASGADRSWLLGHYRPAPNQYLAVIYFTDGTFVNLYSRFRPNVNEWHCLALVVDVTSAALYIDGRLDVSVSYTKEVKSTGTIDIGRLANAGIEYFNGLISEKLIYNRVLSAGEIRWNYLRPDNPIRDGLILWLSWDSIDPIAGKWSDLSGNGNHGTIYGATPVELPLWQVEAQLWR